jgi:drug/metabolite transporter (DMT)-like permease
VTETSKGYFWAVASSVLFASAILASKEAMMTMTPWGYTSFWFLCGAAGYAAYFVIRREWRAFRPEWSLVRAGLMLGVLDAGVTLASMSALQVLVPAVRGFLGHMSELLTTIVGLVILRERFRAQAIVGIVMAFVGVVAVTVRTDIVMRGFLLMFVTAVFFAASSLVGKRFTRKHPPIYLSFQRTISLSLVLFFLSFTIFDVRLPVGREWGLVVLCGFLGPFLHYLCLLNALKRIELGRISVIRLSYSVFVLIGGYIIYDQLLSTRQFIGGIAVVLGGALVIIEGDRAAKRALRPQPG